VFEVVVTCHCEEAIADAAIPLHWWRLLRGAASSSDFILRSARGATRNDRMCLMNLSDLRKSPLFEGLTDDELRRLMENAKPVSLRAGEYLLKQGDVGDAAYVVVKGEFEVSKQSGQSLIKIDVRNPGDVLGEMALLSSSPRSA